MVRAEGHLDGAPARYWTREPDGRIRCDVCPRRCRLRPGQRGMCYVRARSGGDGLVLTAHSRTSGLSIDPIEKKPLNHFLPGTRVLSFGTVGCNLACKFCQNWHISKVGRMGAEAERATPDEIAAFAARTGCPSVAFTYNDPVIFLEYAVDTAAACRERGVRTVAVTAGYILPGARAEFFSCMDAANVDLKSHSDRFYRKLCGGRLAPVLETLEYVYHETECWLEITTLIIPGENDSPADVHRVAHWVASHLGPEVPLHLSAFHPAWRMSDRPATPPETVRRARSIALAAGLRHVYTGNIRDEVGSCTYCHGCGQPVIERDGYSVVGWALDEAGRCRECGQRCAGVFERGPGEA